MRGGGHVSACRGAQTPLRPPLGTTRESHGRTTAPDMREPGFVRDEPTRRRGRARDDATAEAACAAGLPVFRALDRHHAVYNVRNRRRRRLCCRRHRRRRRRRRPPALSSRVVRAGFVSVVDHTARNAAEAPCPSARSRPLRRRRRALLCSLCDRTIRGVASHRCSPLLLFSPFPSLLARDRATGQCGAGRLCARAGGGRGRVLPAAVGLSFCTTTTK